MNKLFLVGMFLSIAAVAMSFGCLEKDFSNSPTRVATYQDVLNLAEKSNTVQNVMVNDNIATQSKLDTIIGQQREIMGMIQSVRNDIKGQTNDSPYVIKVEIRDAYGVGTTESFNDTYEAMKFLNAYR